MMLVFMVSLAGIPPTAGFLGKFYVFMAAVEAGLSWLAAVALLFAAVSAYYYMRVVMLMYMREPEAAVIDSPRLVTSPALSIVLACQSRPSVRPHAPIAFERPVVVHAPSTRARLGLPF
jgi:NADH-quinone oxidoreductase subunit N